MRARDARILTDGIRLDGEYRQLFSALCDAARRDNDPLPLLVSGLSDGAADAMTLSLVEDLLEVRAAEGVRIGSTLLFLYPDERSCEQMQAFLGQFGIRAEVFSGRDLNFYNITASHEYEHRRIRVLFDLISGNCDVVLTTPETALGYTIPPGHLIDRTVRIDFDTRIDPEKLAEKLSAAGYARVDMVDQTGQFAIRGSIIDIFAPNATFTADKGSFSRVKPLRIELFDDEVDRMVLFDPETQRTIESIESAALPPAREVLLDEGSLADLKKELAVRQKRVKDEKARDELKRELLSLETMRDVGFLDKYISFIYPERISLLDYFADRTPVFIYGTVGVNERVKASEWRLQEQIKELSLSETVSSKYLDYSKTHGSLELFLGRSLTVHIDPLGQGMTGKRVGGLFGFRSKHTVSYYENPDLLIEDLSSYHERGYRTIVTVENETSAKNLAGLLTDKGFRAYPEVAEGEFVLTDFPAGTVLIKWRQSIRGYELPIPKIAVLSTTGETRIGSVATARRRAKRKKKANEAILSYADLREGDLVVHETYGIGRYTGIESLTVDGVTRDYINIQYAGSDKLFLPVDKLDKVSKYIGADSESGKIRLSSFGGRDWTRAKSRAKASVRDMAKELIALYAARSRRPGYAFPPDDDFQRSFEAAFEYEETDGQLSSIEDIKGDMEKAIPMDRLLCGDVGFGKTEVALRAAYKAVLGGKQVAILVPTTLLALQHFQTAVSRMRGFAVNIDMVSRFRTPKEQEVTLRRLLRGEIDIIIGTHRLISKDVKFRDLGLLIIDEEQRFGVAQKEKLKQISENVDVLTLTATPIPRTLNMAMGGIRDISVLDEAPGDRLPVQTYVLEHDDLIITDAIRKELHRGGQVFWLHNAVETIDECAARLGRALPDARITVAHGKMKKDELEEIWGRMLQGEIDVLVCTTIIETGVDIPNANTLIVDNAHRLGLSQLHQIRGRVGRSSRRAYAYFTYPPGRVLSEIAEKRLSAIRDYAEFGAGFKIALRDLEIRGAGDLLGASQHGHLDAVGYDLFIKLLNNAVLEEKGVTVEEKPECTVTLLVNAYLPEKYVPYAAQRISFYKRIALIETEYDRDDVLDEMVDLYGTPPKEAENLLSISLIRSAAIRAGITSIVQESSSVRVYVRDFDPQQWLAVSADFPGKLRILALDGGACVAVKLTPKDDPVKLIYNLLQKYLENVQK
ncbi:MAG: transcription-repair coupling factor [Clostridia bacterium]|nr:transcription-repair coupling factor [Clostridia bacterium]